MWSQDTPPPPNTLRTDFTGYYPDDGKICWFPCIGGLRNNVEIPDMRGQMIVGQGKTNGYANSHHHFYTLLSKVGGNVPVRSHEHQFGDENREMKREFSYQKPLSVGTDHDWTGDFGSGNNWLNQIGLGLKKFKFKVGGVTNSGNFQWNVWGKDIIPYSVVVQFWIRIR